MQFFNINLKDYFPVLDGIGEGCLSCYIADANAEIDPQVLRPSVLILPGGAYMYCSRREAEPVALQYLSKGMNAFVLYYAVAPQQYPAALQQAMAAIALIRRQREAWHANGKVCCLGFSAGGHLAACAANLFQDAQHLIGLNAADVRPDASILCYPVISSGKWAHVESFKCLCGQDAAMQQSLSMETRVTQDTPPTFLWHTSDDQGVPVQNSLLYACALAEKGVQFETHVFPSGVHGLSCANQTSASKDYLSQHVNSSCERWLELSVHWLKEIGIL